MKDVLFALLHLTVVAAKLCGPGGVRVVMAENLLLTQQLIVCLPKTSYALTRLKLPASDDRLGSP
jgi:hypothetical protein